MANHVCKTLVWNIRKSLLNLSTDKSTDPVPGKDSSKLDAGDQEGCLEYINAFMYSIHLLEAEDRGMN